MSKHHVGRGTTRLAYERRGSGTPVALVQGLGLSGRMWLQLPGGLVKSGYQVVIPDNRGTGDSDASWPPYTMGQMADDLAAVIRDATETPALVVGISLGGMIAQHLALRHPQLVRGLVLAATTCGPPVGRLPGPLVAWTLIRSLRGDPSAVQRVREMMVHRDTLAAHPNLFARWESVIKQQPLRWQGQLGQLAAASLHSTGLRLHRIRCPTVVVAGEDDRVVNSRNSRILAARIPGARLMMLPRCGHAFPLERPDALPRAIRLVETMDSRG